MDTICEICSKQYAYAKKKGHTKTRCNTCVSNTRRRKIDSLALEYKGGKCQICGYDKCFKSMHFHHINPSEKEFGISGNWGLSWEKIKIELDKCILVCANCHGEIHAGMHSDSPVLNRYIGR